MRELHDALPIPEGWDEPKTRRIIERTRNRTTTDTTAVRLTDRAGEPVTLIGTSVRARLVGVAGPLLLGIVVTFWIVAYSVEAWAWNERRRRDTAAQPGGLLGCP